MVRQAPVICVMAPPIHLGVWSMLWLPFELLDVGWPQIRAAIGTVVGSSMHCRKWAWWVHRLHYETHTVGE